MLRHFSSSNLRERKKKPAEHKGKTTSSLECDKIHKAALTEEVKDINGARSQFPRHLQGSEHSTARVAYPH